MHKGLIILFSAYDLQNSQYFHSGRNMPTKQECTNDIINFLTMDKTLNNECWDIPDEAILSMFEVRVDEHEKKIEEETW